jgi:hypothetical protein
MQYMGKGIPNKTCELMAAGKPILAYGAESFSGLRYLQENRAALIATQKSELVPLIRQACANASAVRTNSEHGFALVRDNHDAARIRKSFLELTHKVAGAAAAPLDANAVEPDRARLAVEMEKKQPRERRAGRSVAYGAALARLAPHLPLFAVRAVARLRRAPLPVAVLLALTAASFAVTDAALARLIAAAGAGGGGWVIIQVAISGAALCGEELDARSALWRALQRSVFDPNRLIISLAASLVVGVAASPAGFFASVVGGAGAALVASAIMVRAAARRAVSS